MANKKYKVSIYEVWPDMKQYIRSKLKGSTIKISEELLTVNNLDKDTEILTVFAASQVTKEIINSLPKLKMIATMSTGYNHINTKTAKAKKIPVCNVPVYGQNTVAEHAFALLLGLSRKIFPSVKRVKEGSYEYDGLRGVDLQDKTIGVVGTGNIGVHLIKMAKGFGMNVVCFDAFPNKDLAKKLDFKYLTLNKLLETSDFISLHVPLFPTTFHLINKKNIKKVKKGAYLINTARGELIESEALLWALENGILAGAGLDVLEEEANVKEERTILQEEKSNNKIKTTKIINIEEKIPKEKMKTMLLNEIIIDHPNTIVTPHNAFNSTEALQRIIDTTVENIKSFIKGDIQNDVTKPKKKR